MTTASEIFNLKRRIRWLEQEMSNLLLDRQRVNYDERDRTPLDFHVDLPVRAYNALKYEGVTTVGDLRFYLKPDMWGCCRMEDLSNIGMKSVQQAREALAEFDAKWDEGAFA